MKAVRFTEVHSRLRHALSSSRAAGHQPQPSDLAAYFFTFEVQAHLQARQALADAIPSSSNGDALLSCRTGNGPFPCQQHKPMCEIQQKQASQLHAGVWTGCQNFEYTGSSAVRKAEDVGCPTRLQKTPKELASFATSKRNWRSSGTGFCWLAREYIEVIEACIRLMHRLKIFTIFR